MSAHYEGKLFLCQEEVSNDISFLFSKRVLRKRSGFRSADVREGEKMEPASDSNLSVPPRGAKRVSQLFLFPLSMDGEKTDESRETIPRFGKGSQPGNGMIGGGSFDIESPLLSSSKKSST